MKSHRAILGLTVLLAGWLTLSALTVPSVSSVLHPTETVADSLKHDPNTGLVVDERLTLVTAQCTACHSSKLILQNRFTRDGWKEKIRWMQRTQKLWDLGESEPVILDYLVKYYGPEQKAFDGRRKPLPTVQWYKL
ncbi:hypothetical protein [Larkinella arboricola]|uniref:Sulfite dehydrogenase (Cytochrome) subunit SorB n=1 Tax=Larkinella arboricola TaxID=643671 RepID=A0A327WWY8_LARAB|nr:hypothetical protein [Larkinella arboricola]RAJ95955.1 hypothetical protein LX87_03705 [Larkinella arboricola]